MPSPDAQPDATLLLAAVRAELECAVRRLGLTWRGDRAEGAFADTTVIAAVTGIGAKRALQCLHRVINERHVTRIIHIGFAGGLDPALRAGDVKRIGRVCNTEGQTVTLDASHDTLLLTHDRLAATVDEKRALFERSGAQLVDMETYPLAAAMQAGNTTLVALRGVSDPADTALPRAALQWVDPHGEASMLRTLGWLARHPGECVALWRLARRTRRTAERLTDEVERLVKQA